MNYFLFISANVEQLFYKLVYMSIVASILGVSIFGITRILKNKISPKWVSRIWLLFIIALIIPIQFKSIFSIYNFIPEDIEVTFSHIKNAQDSLFNKNMGYEKNFPRAFEATIEAGLNIQSIEESDIEELTQNFEKDFKKIVKESSPTRISNILPCIWIFSVLTLTILYILVYINFILKLKNNSKVDDRLNRILANCKSEMNVKRKIKIVYQNIISMPSIFGIFKIKILINNDATDLSDKQLSYIIKHELAHYKRKDNILNIFITIFRCLYIFNPVIFFLLKKVKKDLELATDELAMENENQEVKKEYLKTLVILSERENDKFLVQTLCLSDEKKNLERRIDSLKFIEIFRTRYFKITILSIAILVILSLTCFTRSTTYMKKVDIRKILATENTINIDNYYIKEVWNDSVINETYVSGDKYKEITSGYQSFSTEREDVAPLKSITYSNGESEIITFYESFSGRKLYYTRPNLYNEVITPLNLLNEFSYGTFHEMSGEKYYYKGTEIVNGHECHLIEFNMLVPYYISMNEFKIEKVTTSTRSYWIDINTGLLMKKYNGSDTTTYYYEFGNVKEEEFIMPDKSEYTEDLRVTNAEILDFYEVKEKAFSNPYNSEDSLKDFEMLEELSNDIWAFDINKNEYILKDEFVFDFKFVNIETNEYYILTVTLKDKKIVQLETGRLNEAGELIVSKKEY